MFTLHLVHVYAKFSLQCVICTSESVDKHQDFQERSALSLRNCPLDSSVSGGSRARYTAVSAPVVMSNLLLILAKCLETMAWGEEIVARSEIILPAWRSITIGSDKKYLVPHFCVH